MSKAEEEARALIDLGRSVVDRAIEGGADVAEAGAHSGSHLSVKVRMGEPELVEEAGSRALGLRVMIGQRVASTYTSDLSDAGQRTLIEDALELARLSESDEFAGPPDPSELSSSSQWADLETFDEAISQISADEALARALRGERAAFDSDPRITNSEGASFTRARGVSALVTSGGFAGSDYGTYASIVVNPVADDEDGKKRSGYHWSASRHYADLEDSQGVGEEAARRAEASNPGAVGHLRQRCSAFDPRPLCWMRAWWSNLAEELLPGRPSRHPSCKRPRRYRRRPAAPESAGLSRLRR